MDAKIAELREMTSFQRIAKDPLRVAGYLKKGVDPLDVVQGILDPFAVASVEKKREILEKLKFYQENFMASTQGRSEKFKAMSHAISNIDLDNEETYNRQLWEVVQSVEAYTKGRKTLRSNLGERARFDQALDILSIVGETSEFARDYLKGQEERINHVRTRWKRKQPTVSLDMDKRAFCQEFNQKWQAHKYGAVDLPQENIIEPADPGVKANAGQGEAGNIPGGNNPEKMEKVNNESKQEGPRLGV